MCHSVHSSALEVMGQRQRQEFRSSGRSAGRGSRGDAQGLRSKRGPGGSGFRGARATAGPLRCRACAGRCGGRCEDPGDPSARRRLPVLRRRPRWLRPPAPSPHSGLLTGRAEEARAAGARGRRTQTDRLTEPTNSPRKATAASPQRFRRGAGLSRSPRRGRPPPRSARRRRRRTYRGRESGRGRLTALTRLREQTLTPAGTGSLQPPARSVAAHARAVTAPGRAGGRAGHAGSGSFSRRRRPPGPGHVCTRTRRWLPSTLRPLPAATSFHPGPLPMPATPLEVTQVKENAVSPRVLLTPPTPCGSSWLCLQICTGSNPFSYFTPARSELQPSF